MSDSRRLIPFTLLLLVLAGCKSVVTGPRPLGVVELGTLVPTGVRGVCSSSNGNPDRDDPFICVDDLVSPPVVKIKNLPVHDRVGPHKVHPVMIKWLTVSPSKDLVIRFAPNNPCVENVVCFRGRGFCRAHTKKVTSDTPCEYTATVDGAVADPVIIVQPCCTYMDGFAPEAVP